MEGLTELLDQDSGANEETKLDTPTMISSDRADQNEGEDELTAEPEDSNGDEEALREEIGEGHNEEHLDAEGDEEELVTEEASGREEIFQQEIDEGYDEEHVGANEDKVDEEAGAEEVQQGDDAAIVEEDGDDAVMVANENDDVAVPAKGLKSSGKRSKVPVDEDSLPVGLPVSRVKRIIKLDPDIRLVSKDGIFAIIHTTQLFLESFASKSLLQAKKCKRKGVKADDPVVVSKANSTFRDCLGNSLTDFLRSLNEGDDEDGDESERDEDDEDNELQDEEDTELSRANKSGHAKKKKKLPPLPTNNHSMTDFFRRRAVEETT